MALGKVALNNIYKCLHARGRPALQLQSSYASRFLSSQSGDDQNDGSKLSKDKNEEKKSETKEKAKSRLNDLLQSIMKDQENKDPITVKKSDARAIEFKLAKPMKVQPSEKTEEEINVEKEEKEVSKEIGKEMLSAVKTVAKSVKGDTKAIESELVQKLKSHSPGNVNLSEIFEGMKIDRTIKPESSPPKPSGDTDLSRAHRVRRVLDDHNNRNRERRGDGSDIRDNRGRSQFRDDRQRQNSGFSDRRRQDQGPISYTPMDIFGAPPLGIFSTSGNSTPSSNLMTWDALYSKDLKSATTHPPANGFEEMILWTEQGKLWHYPIDNEQGLEQEAKISFHEHVFLEPQIDGWCPKRGPIRHFMELVCIGLSKNPYLTVQEKHDHLEWYHEYFMGKADIIKEVGAGEIK